jgi:hypothetical protein
MVKLKPGQVFGGWTLEASPKSATGALKSGGEVEVWLAEHADGRIGVLKYCMQALPPTYMRKRFVLESDLMVKLTGIRRSSCPRCRPDG